MAERQFLTQVGRAVVDRPFHDLRKITRIFSVNGGGLPVAQINSEVLIPYGSADPEFVNALLVDRQMAQTSSDKSSYVTGLTEVYQEFSSGEKVNVGEDQITHFEDGRSAMVRRFVCLATQAESLAASIGDLYLGRACNDVKVLKHGVGAEIIETYVSAGILSTSTDYRNNGKLELRSLTYFNMEPPTPSGFVLVGKDVKSSAGVPTYTYNFAKGDGEVSRKTSYRSSVDAGTNGITIVSITHLTAPAVNTNPTTAPDGTNLIDIETSEDTGHRVWTVVYAKGIGVAEIATEGRPDGSIVYTVSELGASADTPAYPGSGTGVLVKLRQDQGEGYFFNTATWVKLPATDTISVRTDFPMPGFAFYSGTQLILRPPTSRALWAERETSYGAGQLTPATWSVEKYGSFSEFYTPTATGQPVSSQRALGGYLCGGNTVFGTDDYYNGVLCDQYSATTYASVPDDLPSGETVIFADNEEYLTALDGTKYYRRTKLTADL